METALITIGIEKKIDVNSNEELFTQLHHIFMEELSGNSIAIPPRSNYKWLSLKKNNFEVANKIETILTRSFLKELKQQPFIIPTPFVIQGIGFSPDKIKVNYQELRNAETGSFIFCYKSDLITLIMKLSNGELLCAAGDRIKDVAEGYGIETFVLTLSDELTISSYQASKQYE